MIADFINDEPALDPAPSPIALALQQKIGWLCQLIRIAAIAWSAWIFYLIVALWRDRERVATVYARAFDLPATPLSDVNYFTGFGLQLLAWALSAAVAFALWRLFSRYLAGEIFTVSAALELRRLATVGAAALIIGIAERPLIFSLATGGHADPSGHIPLFQPNDLLDAIFVTFLFSLAYIFKTAAEMAEDHAQIV